MAYQVITPVQIGQTAMTTRYSTVYTVPANTRTYLKQMDICNTSASPINIYVSIVPSSGTADTTNSLYYATQLTGNTTLSWSGTQIMNTSSTLQVKASATGVTITESPYEIGADNKGELTPNVLEFSTEVNYAAGLVPVPFIDYIYANRNYVVRGVPGDSVLYNSITYYPGDSFVGVSGVVFFTRTGTARVKGCIRIKNYDKFSGGSSYKIIDLLDEFWDYRSMASHCYLKGYWREETYRFGIVAWDKFGNPYAVRWIGDKTIASQSHSSGDYKLLKGYAGYAPLGGDDYYNLIAMGLSFDNIDITDIADKISGISIVRVERDKTVLAQALLLQCVHREQGTVSAPVSTCQPVYDWWVSQATDENTAETNGILEHSLEQQARNGAIAEAQLEST